MNDTYYMEMALALAEKGKGFTSPNPLVGAVVVNDGKVVGKGYHKIYGGPHAEVNAINDAGPHAEGATIYVTLEPCNHTGNTPPCTEKILNAGIKRLVMAMPDPNPVASGGADFLKSKGIDVTTGILEKKAEKINEIFIKYVKTKQPFVILKCASTLDGRIATRTGDSKWISGPESRIFVHKIRHLVDGIMVGVDTVKADNPSLTTRLEGITGKDPRRIILDTRLTFPEDANMLQLDSDSDTIIVCGAGASGNSDVSEKMNRLKSQGVTLIETPLKNGLIDLNILMKQLAEYGLTSLLIEGGSRVIGSALNAGIVDKVFLFYAPKILGGDDGIPICRGTGPELMKDSIKLKDMKVCQSGSDIMIEAYVNDENALAEG